MSESWATGTPQSQISNLQHTIYTTSYKLIKLVIASHELKLVVHKKFQIDLGVKMYALDSIYGKRYQHLHFETCSFPLFAHSMTTEILTQASANNVGSRSNVIWPAPCFNWTGCWTTEGVSPQRINWGVKRWARFCKYLPYIQKI